MKYFLSAAYVLIFCLAGKSQIVDKSNYPSTQNNTLLSTQSLQLGLVKFKAKDYKGALLDFEKAIEYNSLNGKAYRSKGDVEQELNLYRKAVESYTKALEINKTDTLSYKGRANSQRMSDSYQESLGDYDIALKWDPNDPIVHFGRGSVRYKLGNYEGAITDFNFSISKLPKASIFYLKRSLAYVENSQYSEAKKDLKKYLQLGGKEEGVFYYLGLSNAYLGDFDPSLADSAIYYLTIYVSSMNKSNSNDPTVYQLLGMAYSQKKDTAKTRLNFRKSLSLDSENKDTYFRWGNAELNFGDYRKANDLFTETNKRIKSPSAGFYYHSGLAKIGIKDTTEAVNNFTKALALDSNKRDVYEYRIIALFNSNKYHKVVLSDLNQLTRLAKEDQEKAEWHSVKGMIDIRVKDTLAARLEIEKAIKLRPEEPMHYMVRALLSATTNRSKEIILKDVDKAIRIDPTMAEAYLFKATYYALHGDHKNGCATLKWAIKTGASVPKEVENYICKGKMPKSGKVPELFIPFSPRLIIRKELIEE